ncbi:MAG: sulfate adenylyltransferase subunit 2 [Lachnospiraceae bacterium]|nr:sulfate adenylyltransferase subunit 2 [Lachnospiraceae bacterium]
MMDYLDKLEAESIYILREASLCESPVLLFSAGKDSAVLLHLCKKAFAPLPIPFPFLHIDTTWKFREMIEYRNAMAEKYDLNMNVYVNEEGIKIGLNPFDDKEFYTDVMKTEALKKALCEYGYRTAIGGARRDEDKIRAKERIFSHRGEGYSWNPTRQRPEFGYFFNTMINENESLRVFPLSNWTEIDIWKYIQREKIDVVSLYFAKERQVINRGNGYLMVDDERMKITSKDKVEVKKIRFRSLGCYPLTEGFLSDADTVDDIIEELQASRISERAYRLIDKDKNSTMEAKKTEGYF